MPNQIETDNLTCHHSSMVMLQPVVFMVVFIVMSGNPTRRSGCLVDASEAIDWLREIMVEFRGA